MGKGKKHTKAKKKTKTKTVRKDGSVRTTPEAADIIQNIAYSIFGSYGPQLKQLGFHRPSAKVAIDYLLSMESEMDDSLSPEQTPENNLYNKIIAMQRGGE